MRLIDADALVYALTEMVRHSTGEYKNGICAARLVAMEAPTVATDTNVPGKWISVKDRLPDDSAQVLCRVAMLCDYPDCNQYDVEDYFVCEGRWDENKSSRFRGWYIFNSPDIHLQHSNKHLSFEKYLELYKF